MRLALGFVALIAVAPSARGQSTQKLERELARIEPLSGGTLGIAATHIESGRTVFYKADEQYPLASTYKVPIAVEALLLACTSRPPGSGASARRGRRGARTDRARSARSAQWWPAWP